MNLSVGEIKNLQTDDTMELGYITGADMDRGRGFSRVMQCENERFPGVTRIVHLRKCMHDAHPSNGVVKCA